MYRLCTMMLLGFVVSTCTILPSSKKIGLRFSTNNVVLPDSLTWREIGFAKELINIKDKTVVISGGSNPIPLETWDNFKPSLPWKKNLDRNLLFEKTAFLRSPNKPVNCKGTECLEMIEYKNHSWLVLAQPVSVDFIPKKTNILKPEAGHLVIKTIKKCQVVDFGKSIWQLTDNKGNYYVMHATEVAEPNLNVILPEGWSLKKVELDSALIVSPFGTGDECYFNIVGDHLGQGYHQYVFAKKNYPQE